MKDFFSFFDLGPSNIVICKFESTRKVLRRSLRKEAKTWITVFPQMPITKKPQEVRMGKGKGSVEYWVAQIKPGQILFEMQGVDEIVAMEAFELAAAKLPVKTTIIKRTIM
jgi:large subunit ribosomal protein L16